MKHQYEIKNGKLIKDGKAVFALGQSYYPSFHEAKYPVPPEGDRMGEMRKDLKLMSEMGFNHIRYAAIGETKLNEKGEVTVNTPFVDAMVEEAGKNGISVSVRLQGYAMNLHGYENVLMIDNDGEEQDVRVWSNFIRTTLHHEGMREDNRLATRALAEHFDGNPDVVAFQIYNEPHYPTVKFFDYHPCAIEAYRKWLVKEGHMSAEEAKDYQPPRSRKEQEPRMWGLWRLFAMESLTEFLNDSSDAAKEVSSLPTYTCLTTCQTSLRSAFRGVNNFDNPRGSMDILGYTNYINAEGEDFYATMMAMDLCATAAWAEGKEAWCIELDSRTKIPLHIFNKNTYACIGSGVKGIVYYQWRGDHPSPATPIPNGCGLVNYDGSHTPNYDNAGAMVKMINRLSDYLVDTKAVNSHVGIFLSDYSNFCYDAIDNYEEHIKEPHRNTHSAEMSRAYRDLTSSGYTVTFTDGKGLEKNATDIRVLFVPGAAMLLPREQTVIETFIAKGGRVYILSNAYQCCSAGYYPWGTTRQHYTPFMSIEDVLDEVAGVIPTPSTRSTNRRLVVRELRGEGYRVLSLINISCPHKPLSGELICDYPVQKATLYSNTAEPQALSVKDGHINLVDVADGGLILVE
ncbi:MAG: beta-galactosidase [Clostridia bacterium]|nr:beta-galactosidase [Clostridia bacterium]